MPSKQKQNPAFTKAKTLLNQPKKPLNAFFLYRRAMKEQVASQGVSKSHEVSKHAAVMWKNEPESVKDVYRKQAQVEFARHKETYPDYVWPSRSTKSQQTLLRSIAYKPPTIVTHLASNQVASPTRSFGDETFVQSPFSTFCPSPLDNQNRFRLSLNTSLNWEPSNSVTSPALSHVVSPVVSPFSYSPNDSDHFRTSSPFEFSSARTVYGSLDDYPTFEEVYQRRIYRRPEQLLLPSFYPPQYQYRFSDE